MDWISNLVADGTGGDYLLDVSVGLLVAYGLWRLYWSLSHPGEDRPYKRFGGLTLQIGITLLLERLYEFSRAHVAVDQLTALGISNGYRIADLEMAITHGFLYEQVLEHYFINDVLLMHAIYVFYAFAHLFVTLGLLIWVYVRRNQAFAFVRNMFYLTTGVAMIVYMTFPTSPPRFFYNLGFANPEVLLGISPAGGADATAQTLDVYAAMPSLHMVYALIVGATLVMIGRHWYLRVFGVLYPAVMLFVVLTSGNHWILDTIAAGVVVAGSAGILWVAHWLVGKLPPVSLATFRFNRRAAIGPYA